MLLEILNENLLNQKMVRRCHSQGADFLDSDSDASSIGQAPTNRGRKLKRNARYVHRGRLARECGLTLDGAVIQPSLASYL